MLPPMPSPTSGTVPADVSSERLSELPKVPSSEGTQLETKRTSRGFPSAWLFCYTCSSYFLFV